MIKSVRGKLFAGIVGLIALFVLLSWALNWGLLDGYYRSAKRGSLVNAYLKLRKLYQGEAGALLLELETMERREGFHIVVVDPWQSVKYDTVPDRRGGSAPTPDRLPRPGSDRWLTEFIVRTAQDMDGDYVVLEATPDERLRTEFMSLVGLLANGDYLFLRTPVTAIQESAATANRFFFISGSLMIIVGIVFAFVFAGWFTRPILEMKGIAEKMARLDFSSKYRGSSHDEIGALGASINLMSDQLERSIGELVTANEKLLEDIERERRIDDMRKEFIANVSHELKTPIAMIQGYAEGLKLNVIEDEENRNFYCDVIADEAARMNRLVSQLLSLARIESGNAAPDMICFDIVEMARRVLRKSCLVLQERGIDASTEGEERALVSADYDMIEQVMTNYITNAINHAAGDNMLRVRIDSTPGKVRVSVLNSGEPIPLESIDSIWTSFYKTDKARTREHGGTGLGLSIVKAIQDAHGNGYGASNVDGGVEFWFDVNAAAETGLLETDVPGTDLPETDLDMSPSR